MTFMTKLVFMAALTAPPPIDPSAPFADDNSCTLVGGAGAPVLLEVYDENSFGGNGPQLWVGSLGRDQTIPIRSSAGRIRYNYRYRSNEPWSANVGAWCRGSARVSVP